jgi:predicted deacylase
MEDPDKHMAEWGEFTFGDISMAPGTSCQTAIEVGSDPLGQSSKMPVHIIHGASEGPTLAVTAAIHGNELNGTGIIHHLIYGADHEAGTKDDHIDAEKMSGTLILVPVVNVEGMLLQQRHSTDGRDINRLFPGKPNGNHSQRLAHALFDQVVRRADHLIDLHTAPSTRMNVPHVRADLDDKACKKLARAFGTEVILHSNGPDGSIRREAVDSGVPTILLESGTSHRFEPQSLKCGVRGILNVMARLGMIERRNVRPSWRILVRRFRWVRSTTGGLLHSLIEGGASVKKGEVIAHVTDPFGSSVESITSPVTGYVIGLATTPLVRPGDPIANVVIVREKKLQEIIEKDTAAGRRPREHVEAVEEQEVEDDGGSTLDETES